MVVLRYDWITAHKEGIEGNPVKLLTDLGYKVYKREDVAIADCTFLLVDKLILPLPLFLKEQSDFQFTE